MAKQRQDNFEKIRIMIGNFSNLKSKHIIMKNNKIIVHKEKNQWTNTNNSAYLYLYMYICLDLYGTYYIIKIDFIAMEKEY